MPNPARNHKSLALIVCGKTTGKTHAENGDYVDIYKRFLTASLDSLKPKEQASSLENPNHSDNPGSQPLWQFTIDPYDVFLDQPLPIDEKLNDYDGIIITGSPASAYDNVPWINNLVEFTKHVADTRPKIKLIGICFGHQIIARALGGECVPNSGIWEVGPTPITLTDLGKQIFGVDSINLEEMHRDHVPADRVPPSFEILGSTSISANQGMVRFYPASESDVPRAAPSLPPSITDGVETQTPILNLPLLQKIQIFTVQGHPEWHEKVLTPLVEERGKSGIIDAPTAEDAMRRRFWRNDGVPVAGPVIWSILGVE
ncbi:cytoplasmic protein [Coprinopsis marcescibilis]|uniref:Cytoplasmic protein n=1 Tax=Coprinopsis marcescibilis TaxID=230819 RepID=A0A5C3KU46_COPMA|nr:cytoplasmic protein [Coprinopsis marcescibilis]